MLTGLDRLLTESPVFRELKYRLHLKQVDEYISISEPSKAFLIGVLWRQFNVPILVVSPKPEEARRLYDTLQTYGSINAPIYHFSEADTLPFERLTRDTTTVHQRLQALAALTGIHKKQCPVLVIASAPSLALKTIEGALLSRECHTIHMGDQVSMERLVSQWKAIGYSMERAAEVPGTMSRRGGILDIFVTGEPLPVRLEFLGEAVESIRTYDPGTQRSLGAVEQVQIIPALEILPNKVASIQVENQIRGLGFNKASSDMVKRIEEEISLLINGQEIEELGFYSGFFNGSSIVDLLPKEGLLVLDQETELEEALIELDRRTGNLRETKAERGEIPRGFPSPYLSWEEIAPRLKRVPRKLSLSRWSGKGLTSFPFGTAPSFQGRLEEFFRDTQQRTRKRDNVIVVSNHARRLLELMRERDLGPTLSDCLSDLPVRGSITLVQGSLMQGWSITSPHGETTLFTDAEVFGTVKVARPSRSRNVPREAFLSELTPGSYVVHTDHGVSRFAGTTTIQDNDHEREYLLLEYADEDKLYVPTDHLDRVSLYTSPGDRPPTLTRLGTQEWARIKERVKRSTLEMAKELLELYAARETQQGISFSSDGPWQQELEDAFPYVETQDQITAIHQVKEDMERPNPMDRLVCGDVGYGKTEVALRAAFKAVLDGAQVAVLVPTTVLAQQHYITFSERLSPYPVKVEMLSRFRKDHEQRQVVSEMADGKVDICIGTHRLLQKDIEFKNLGLVIVDEEQRFGVAHKERMKQLRREVDVLTLSATPIPRTLHMALTGIRDMSMMETPPEERLPIKTHVAEYSEDLVREAILRELDRGGQVYLVHNRVQTIERMAESIRMLVPEASVMVGHGQLPEEQLEDVMAKFANRKGDILLCTTIIESGLDLPNVNTLIVNRADALGLGQLYQLRGRIGRGAHRAYAYFLVPRGKRITETAQKRLETILAATELGAGFRIAMKDMEIRGAGNILGAQQSGYIHAIGFDLYSKMLSNAVEETKGKGDSGRPIMPEGRPEVAINLDIKARLPIDYIEDLPTRLGLYQALIKAHSIEAVDQMREELLDRFGTIPQEASNLLYSVRVRVWAEKAGAEAVIRQSHGSGNTTVRLREEVGGAKLALAKAFSEAGLPVRIGSRLLHLEGGRLMQPWTKALLSLLKTVASFRERVAGIG
ncbi:MAG: transcription-repair coupling factor [SAR202 cluster bacterium Io17-Chloro-G3]|nr:MAG: transcription-repair coupling factor [SAR202 cluster bacterium Io17-Chloro-G3]